MPTAQELDRITALLKEGKVQEASDLSTKLSQEASAEAAARAGFIPEPPPARARDEILSDILHQICHDLGNRPGLEALLREYDEADK